MDGQRNDRIPGVRNLETLQFCERQVWPEKRVLDHSMYTWNDEAADFWKDQKVLRNTVPLELNEGEIRHRDNRDSEMLISRISASL